MGNIQFNKAEVIKKSFQERKMKNPDLICNHEKRPLKEYYLGTATGDYICPDCGEVVETK